MMLTKEHSGAIVASGFGRDLSALRTLHNEKWRRYGDDVLPAFVAEMDFAVAEPVRAALAARLARQDFGYPLPDGHDSGRVLADAFTLRMAQRFDWQPDPGLVITMGDIVQGLYAAVLAFSNPGDGIIVLMPSYPKIREAVTDNQRVLLPLEMRDDGQRFVFDPDELDALAVDGARMLILCNPHNPTGRVFSREELSMIGACAERHDLVVISDEIHADLVYAGHRHVPFASVNSTCAARSLTLNAATKSFNIPGVRCGFGAFGGRALYQRFTQVMPPRLLGDPNVFGMDATLAAWRHGQPWLDAVLAQLAASRDHALWRLSVALPEIVVRQPEATYLAWLDCTALALRGSAGKFFLQHGKVALSPGKIFMDGDVSHVRLNFATTPEILDQVLDRMIYAVHG